jgi:di/tricarboxylate transporter
VILSFDQGVVFAILLATLVLFIWGRWRYDVVAIAALLAVFLAGMVPADQVFLGFGHPAVITVAAVLVLSRGLLNAGVVDALSRHLERVGSRPTLQVAALTTVVILCSGFMNNVGALALLMPVAIWMSRKSGRSPSLLLMPLAFGSLLGGLITLIGTPPNIIIALYRAETGAPAFGMFDFVPVGAPVALAGLLFITLLGWRLTPRREAQSAPEELFEIEGYISELVVPEGSKFVGKTIYHLTSEMEKETDAVVVDLVRSNRHTPAPPWYEIIEAGDILMVEAAPEELKELIDSLGLEFVVGKAHPDAMLGAGDVRLMEAVIVADSPLVGRTAANLNIGRDYGINLLAIARRGRQLQRRLRQTKLIVGDILLLQGADESLKTMLKKFRCLPLAERGLRIGQPRNVVLAVGIFAAAMAISALDLAPVQIAFTAASAMMVLTGLVPLKDIYESVDWPIIVLLGAMFPLGHALESTGGAQLIADGLLQLSHGAAPMLVLAMLMVGTMVLSNVVNNAAAAVLMAPIAITLAEGMAVSVDPLLMAVAVGASCAFMTPVGHQSNALVMAPGGYLFGDYWRLGLPLSVIVTVVAVPLIHHFWPMTAV